MADNYRKLARVLKLHIYRSGPCTFSGLCSQRRALRRYRLLTVKRLNELIVLGTSLRFQEMCHRLARVKSDDTPRIVNTLN